MIFLRDGGCRGDVCVHKFMFTNESKYYTMTYRDGTDDANLIIFVVTVCDVIITRV